MAVQIRLRPFFRLCYDCVAPVSSFPMRLSFKPAIAQLVERSTVECAGIEWSLVRFRVAGVLLHGGSTLAAN